MKILMTGVVFDKRGMIASSLKPYLESQGHTVVAFEGDIRSHTAWYRYRNKSFDMVVHLAAKAGVRESLESPELYEDINVNGTKRAFEYCRDNKCKILYASSSNAYEWWVNPYAATKKATEHLASAYPIQAIGMRFHTVWPGRDDMLFKTIERGEVTYINARHTRDFIHVDDLCSAIGVIINNFLKISYRNDKVVDIGTGKEYNVADVYKKYTKERTAILKYTDTEHERVHTKADVKYLHDLGWTHTKDII